MKLDWQFSLYDFFGFLMPGAVLLFALALIYYCLFLPTGVVGIGTLSLEEWVIILGLSYLCGHVAQGITNHLWPWNADVKLHPPGKRTGWYAGWPVIAENSVETARKALGTILDTDWVDNLKAAEVYTLCEHYLMTTGKTSDREMYHYRRGFYRGFSFSSIVAAIAFLACIARPSFALMIGTHSHLFSAPELTALALFCTVSGLIAWNRQKRFVTYIKQLSIYGFLVATGASN